MKTREIFYQKRNREIMHDDVMVATTFHERASVKAPVKTFLAHTSVLFNNYYHHVSSLAIPSLFAFRRAHFYI